MLIVVVVPVLPLRGRGASQPVRFCNAVCILHSLRASAILHTRRGRGASQPARVCNACQPARFAASPLRTPLVSAVL